jgi:PLD-like domain
MAKQSTQLQPSGQATIYNFLLNEVLASQLDDTGTFWIVAPWVTNFRLDKPYYVSFQQIVETKQEALHLFDILHQIAANGSSVNITVGTDSNYHSPLKQLSQQSDRIQVKVLPELHSKIYVGRYGAIDGSFNLTGRGLNQNIELFTYYHDERNLAQLGQVCCEYFNKGNSI